jgi:hypothetical protein
MSNIEEILFEIIKNCESENEKKYWEERIQWNLEYIKTDIENGSLVIK